MADCGVCKKKVAKSAKALTCDFCRLWHHTTCAGLDDSDYDFMKRRKGQGFRWFCGSCIVGADDTLRNTQVESQLDDKLTSVVSAVLQGFNVRLGELEAKFGSTGGPTSSVPVKPESFAAIVRQTVSEVKRNEEQGMKVTDRGKTRVITNKEVLVIKPKKIEGTSTPPPPVQMNDIQNILKSVPVKSCRGTNSGGVVVRFPNEDAKAQANALMEPLMTSSNITVSEPRKMLPKMTLSDVPTSLSDEDIIPGIKNKNAKIRDLLDNGHTLSLVFTRTRENKKMAVLKMSPEIRMAIVQNGGRVFIGLTSCRAYDRFWATQCHHCQKFGHVKERCPNRNDSPVCVFCAGSHISVDCQNKTDPKCANCTSLNSPPERCQHSASSMDCPIMISERERVMENTDFGPSKNF